MSRSLEEALTELINAKRQGKAIAHKPRPSGENIVDLMDALKESIGAAESAPKEKRRSRNASRDQREMIMSVSGSNKPAKRAAKKAAKSDRRSA
jgi:DNA end-binding protein Ku